MRTFGAAFRLKVMQGHATNPDHNLSERGASQSILEATGRKCEAMHMTRYLNPDLVLHLRAFAIQLDVGVVTLQVWQIQRLVVQ